ncbi:MULTISPECIES: hypothetical protein [unclassified Butyrivibrio]|uniref:hypothetical protein n=1 Tax=unclassified Butyrivibrio TaxID=2639466 RepID=UPI0003B4E02F|nr:MULTISPECIES: hypothetical protein [unclassified Butyrivibrio]SEK43386.1 hypothetical protein SAMN04487770_101395 [Butyrivibrio sp. ob235]
MSINRIDFQGNVLRTNDFSQIKQNEDNKVFTDQNAFQTEFNKEVDQKSNSVIKKEDVSQQEKEKHDAKEKGKNEYFGNGGKGKNKYRTPEELEKLSETLIGADGKPLDMHISSGFDFKI